jgi:hypothetical protein
MDLVDVDDVAVEDELSPMGLTISDDDGYMIAEGAGFDLGGT